MAVLFQSLPGKLPLVMPCAVAGAVTAGVAIAVISVRLARVLAYSLGGLTLLVVSGVWAMQMSRPQWVAALPRDLSAQLAVLAGLVVLGVLVQWRLTPAGNAKLAGAGGGANRERSEKE